jgi:hypothetical protein
MNQTTAWYPRHPRARVANLSSEHKQVMRADDQAMGQALRGHRAMSGPAPGNARGMTTDLVCRNSSVRYRNPLDPDTLPACEVDALLPPDGFEDV